MSITSATHRYLHTFMYHKPRQSLLAHRDHDYQGVGARLEAFLDVSVMTTQQYRLVADNCASRFSGLFGKKVARADGQIVSDCFVPIWEILFQIQIDAYADEGYGEGRDNVERWLRVLRHDWKPSTIGSNICVRVNCVDRECQRLVVLAELQRFAVHASALHAVNGHPDLALSVLRAWEQYAGEQQFDIALRRFWDLWIYLEDESGGNAFSRLSEPPCRPHLTDRRIVDPSSLSAWSSARREELHKTALVFRSFQNEYAVEGPAAVIKRGDQHEADRIIELIHRPPSSLDSFRQTVRKNQNSEELAQLLAVLTGASRDPLVIFRALRVTFEMHDSALRNVTFDISPHVDEELRGELKRYQLSRQARQYRGVLDHLADPQRARAQAWVEGMGDGLAVGF